MEDAMSLVRDYLVRLDDVARPLPSARRAELTREVHEHIDAALAEAGRRDEVTIRNILERLGRPEEIVAAEAGWEAAQPGWAGSPPGGMSTARSRWGATEIIALLLLTLGWLLWPIGPLIGLIFVWISARWTRRQKVMATVIVLILLVLPVLGLFAAGGGTVPTNGQPLPVNSTAPLAGRDPAIARTGCPPATAAPPRPRG